MQRIGQALVERRCITRDQLVRALKAQRIFGGRVGTSLIELGYVSEERLGRVLAEVLRVPYAARELFETIPGRVLRCLTRPLVERYRAVPLLVEHRGLHLALIDAGNLDHLDDLAFAAGRPVIPWVSPEHRLQRVIERYYRIRRERRWVPLSPLPARSPTCPVPPFELH